MTLAFAKWVKNELAPSARYRYWSGIKTIQLLGGYSCRRMNNSRQKYNPMSEHAHGNAIDVGKFVQEERPRDRRACAPQDEGRWRMPRFSVEGGSVFGASIATWQSVSCSEPIVFTVAIATALATTIAVAAAPRPKRASS